MIYGYARCSTNEDKQDIQRQVRELKAAGAEQVFLEYEHGDSVVKEQLAALMEEAKAEAEAIRDSIKAEMLDRDTEELEAGQYIIRWTPVLSNRFDTTAFKKLYGDLYKAFTKQTASRRFSISC